MTTTGNYRVIQFRPGEVAGALDARATEDSISPDLVAKRDLSRYYALLERELRGLRLSVPEASLIVDALNGTILNEDTYHLAGYQVADAFQVSALGDKWFPGDPDAARSFFDHLPTMTASQWLAIGDACERFWQRVGAGERADTHTLLRAVGLVRNDEPAQ